MKVAVILVPSITYYKQLAAYWKGVGHHKVGQ